MYIETKIDNKITQKLNSIYGIDKCKNEILNYISYLSIAEKDKFANLNIIIRNNSSYPSETKIKLIEFINDVLNENNIIQTKYEFITLQQLKTLEEKNNNKDNEEFNISNDLIVIDSDKIGRDLSHYKEEIVKIIERYPQKIFILVDNSYCEGEVNAIFSQYFDWYFIINQISVENKKDYILKVLKENLIEIDNKCNLVEKLKDNPFYKLKSILTNMIVVCKINNINKIDDNVIKQYTEKLLDKKSEIKTLNTSGKQNDFNKIIGLNDIKNEALKITNYVKVCQKRNNHLPTLHMCFTGNPGTGKTTVARIIGDIFKKENILSTGNFVEIHGRDLVGKYVGWTAKEVKKYVEEAKGGVLFIDEAYSLNSDRRGSFEDEAIATLIKEMEDNREDLCVILAGYKEEMKELIERNPGFESRIQFNIDFPNYTSSELYEIFHTLARSEGYKLSSHIKSVLIDEFEKRNKTDDFSNGRFVRNLYEKVKIEQANRIMSNNTDSNINLITQYDIESVLKDMPNKNIIKRRIGF